MSHLKQKLAELLTASSRKGIETLGPDTVCSKVLEDVDVENVLTEDISSICKAVSYGEITKILYWSVKLKTAKRHKRLEIKRKLKRLAQGVVEKAEDQYGKLRIPDSCRYLLLNL